MIALLDILMVLIDVLFEREIDLFIIYYLLVTGKKYKLRTKMT